MTEPNLQRDEYECIVVGGGPAGATVATLLAKAGHQTLVLEKARFPRHHIGESLMPQTYSTFQRLGMIDKLDASKFPRKESVQFVSADGAESTPYYFTDRDPSPWSVTWQVRRDTFDEMMLENARDAGAEIQQNVRVSEVLFDGERATGVTALINSAPRRISAKVVVDASGTTGLLSRQLGIRKPEPALRNGAIYAYYQGAHRDEGRNAGATIIIHTPNREGWFWVIPLPDDVTSIGVVAPPSHLFTGRGDNPLATFEELASLCPGIARRIEGARRISDAYVTSDFSYHASRVAGDGWVLVGDAFGFLDPIYSSGVFLALKSGELAADAIHDALSAGDCSAPRLARFGPELSAGMHLIRQLVYAFYDRSFSFGRFSREFPEYRDHIVRLLIGDVFNNEVGQVFNAMRDWVDLPEPIDLDGTSPEPENARRQDQPT
ncbi:MAG: NAD(P)/FAD-dependent oxidoreductase [Phycisphaerae bacterium]|jgi:flavin-dependent dehydrogenase